MERRQVPSFGETPWLVYSHGSSKHKQIQTFYSISDSKSYIKSIPELHEKLVLGYRDGWVILRDSELVHLFSLLNLVTLQTVHLPELRAAPHHPLFRAEYPTSAVLTASPDSIDCVFHLICNDVGLMFSCYPAHPNPSWVEQRLELWDISVRIDHLFTTLNGVVCGTASAFPSEPSALFYLEKPKGKHDPFTLVNLPAPIPLDLLPHKFDCIVPKRYMLESCQRLYLVDIYIKLSEEDWQFAAIKVWELDCQDWSWVEVSSLDGRAFFLSFRASSWCWGTNKTHSPGTGGGHVIQGNCIYFPVFCDEESPFPLYSYNLEDQNFVPLCPCPNLARPNLPLFWVTPRNQRLFSLDKLKKKIVLVDFSEKCHNATQESRFDELPLHLVISISRFMHLFDYCNFRACSKIYHSLCPPPQWRTHNVFPLFMSLADRGKSYKLIDPCRQDSSSNILPFLPCESFTLQFSMNGWLLIFVGQKSLRFFNLFSGVSGAYPPFNEEGNIIWFRSFTFSSYPTCSKCLTVGIVSPDDDDSVLIYYHKSGDKTWKHCRFETYKFWATLDAPVFHGGAFYFMDVHGKLGVFQLNDGTPCWHVYNKLQTKRGSSFYLVECVGELYCVVVRGLGKWVSVSKFDESMKRWVKISYLGNHILFVSSASSSWIVTKDPKMKNRIYLPRLRGGSVVFYSQDTNMLHASDNDDFIEDLDGAAIKLRSCWV